MMTKPIALDVSAFDATNKNTFKFTVSGGSQVVKNRITIRNNITNVIIYQNTIESYKFEQIVPSNILTNGTYYNYYINTYDINNNISENSNIISFYCYETPTLIFQNLPYANIIEESSYPFTVQYSQSNGELLDTLIFYLYNSEHTLINKSKSFTSVSPPPITFTHIFDGLEDDANYYIQAQCSTINDTIVLSDLIKFSVKYLYNGVLSIVELTNHCEDGYVRVKNNTVKIDGISNPSPPIYIDGTKINLAENGYYVKWIDGFSFADSKFIISEWFTPSLFGKFIEIKSANDGDRIEIALRRGIPKNQTVPKDYFEVIGYINNIEYFYQRSNYIDVINNNSNVILWVKKNGNSFDLIFKNLLATGDTIIWNGFSNVMYNEKTLIIWNGETPSLDINVITWNGNSNVSYNRITDIFWEDEIKAKTVTEVVYYNEPLFPINFTKVELTNSIVSHFHIDKDISLIFSEKYPIWLKSTILDCDFENNINGGNVEFLLSQVDNLRFKRRKVGTLNWLTIANIPINTVLELESAQIDDYFVPSGIDFEWATCFTLNGNEGQYFTNKLKTKFDGIFVSDGTGDTLKLYSGTSYPSHSTNRLIGSLQPIGAKYPVIIENSNVNYQTIGITGDILGENFINTRKIDRNEVVLQREKYEKLLNNGKFKIVKDWNGNIWLGKVTTPPSFGYNSNFGMGIPKASFTITEQGKYDNQNDLIETGFIQ